MRRFKTVLCIVLCSITISGPSLYSEEQVADPKPLFVELLKNMPFYLDYLVNTHSFFWSLDGDEREQLQLLQQFLKEYGHTPHIDFTKLREEFVLQKGEPERMAKTTDERSSSIDFNSALVAKNPVDIPLAIQLLIHELGHKLVEKKKQADIDSLATKAALFFKSHTQVLKVSEQESLHVLSLPINWFFIPYQRSWGVPNFRQRGHSALFLTKSDGSFQSLTDEVLKKIGAASEYMPTWSNQNEAFTDSQTFFHGLDRTSEGQISLFAHDEKKLQSATQTKRVFGFQEEQFYKIVDHDHQLILKLPELEVRVTPAPSNNLASSIRSKLEQEADGNYRLILLDIKSSEKLKLRLSTGLGIVLLSQEPSENPEGPISYRFQIPKTGSAEFVEIHSVVGEKQQFLDKSYWFSIDKSSGVETLKADAIQMKFGEEWKEAEAGNEKLVYNRWGDNALRIQLQNSKKIRHVRFVWGFSRRYFKSADMERPQFYQPMGPTIFILRGKMGHSYAEENEVYEDNFSESDFVQEDRNITIPFNMKTKHIETLNFSHISHRISRFFKLTSTVTNHEIRGEDMGNRHLLDILVIDENLQTTSLLKEPLRFQFAQHSCAELMEMAKRHYDRFE